MRQSLPALTTLVAILAGAACKDATAPATEAEPKAVPSTIEAISPLEFTDTAGKTVQVSVRVKDKFGMPIANVSVAGRSPVGAGPDVYAGAYTDSTGSAKLAWRLGVRAGSSYYLTVTAGPAAVTFRATVLADVPRRLLEQTPSGSDGPTNATLPYPIIGMITDDYFNPLKGVRLDIAVAPGGGSIEHTSTVTDDAGKFNAGAWTLGPNEGLQKLIVRTGDFVAEISAYAEACTERTQSGSCTRELAFVGIDSGGDQIYRINYDGSGLTRLTQSGRNFSPSWSPDGERLAFTKIVADSSFLVIADAAGSEIHKVKLSDPVSVGVRPNWSVRWSPDGHTLLLGWEYSAAPRLFLTSADNPGELRMIADMARSGAWSSDASKILFVISGGAKYGHDALGIMNADGSQTIQLTAASGYYGRPEWYPGSSTEFLVPACNSLCLVAKGNVRESQAGLTEVGQLTGFMDDLTWSPDGQMLGIVDSSSDEPDVEFLRLGDLRKLNFYAAHIVAYNATAISWRPRSR